MPEILFDTVNAMESDTRIITIKNIGDSEMNITEFALTSATQAFELVDPPAAPLSLQPDESQTLTVRFSPLNRGWDTAELLVKNNSVNEPDKYIDIRGYGFEAAPILTASHDRLAFDSVYVDSTRSMLVTFCNEGELPLDFASYSIDCIDSENAFALVNESELLDSELQPGECFDAQISFSPTEKADYACTFQVSTNAFNGEIPGLMIIPLEGTGKVHHGMILVANKLDFQKVALGETKDTTIKIENYGDGILNIESAKILLDLKKVFNVKSGQLPMAIDPHSEAELMLNFEPETDKIYSAILQISSDAANGKQMNISLAGEGIDPNSVAMKDGNGQLIELSANPNPFDGRAIVVYKYNGDSPIDFRLELYSAGGYLVESVASGVLLPGRNVAYLDACCLASGTYYLVATAGGRTFELPLVLAR